MRYLILIIVLVICVNCKAQSLPDSFKLEIIDFYISSNEIEKKEKEKLMNGFDGLFTIKELDGKNSPMIKSVGIYSITPNISHTTTILLGYDVNNYEVLSSDNKYETLTNGLNFLKKEDTLDKLKVLKSIEYIIKILKDNEELRNLNVLEFKEN